MNSETKTCQNCPDLDLGRIEDPRSLWDRDKQSFTIEPDDFPDF